MDFSFQNIMAGFIFGTAGYFIFRHGKQKLSYPLVFIGITLMGYSYFVSNPWLNWGIGFFLLGLTYFITKL